jgi:hypothetical protein
MPRILLRVSRVTVSMLKEIEATFISTMTRARESSSVNPLVFIAMAMPRAFIVGEPPAQIAQQKLLPATRRDGSAGLPCSGRAQH